MGSALMFSKIIWCKNCLMIAFNMKLDLKSVFFSDALQNNKCISELSVIDRQ